MESFALALTVSFDYAFLLLEIYSLSLSLLSDIVDSNRRGLTNSLVVRLGADFFISELSMGLGLV